MQKTLDIDNWIMFTFHSYSEVSEAHNDYPLNMIIIR